MFTSSLKTRVRRLFVAVVVAALAVAIWATPA
jgi:hypothetical protein